MNILRSRWLWIGAVIYIAFWCIGLWRILQSSLDFSIHMGDAASYSDTAANIALKFFYSFDGIRPYFEREPGYSAFVSIIYFIFGVYNRVAVFACQGIVYFVCTTFFIDQLRRVLHLRVAMITYYLLLLSPSVFHVLLTVLREGLALPLFLVLAGVLLSIQQLPTMKKAILVGLLLSFCTMTVYSYVFLPIFVIGFFWVWKMPWKHMVPVIFIPIIVVCLWSARTAYYTRYFRPIDTHRTTVMWYVRGEQAERLEGIEPLRCLWAEYISRDWTNRSSACSYNGLMHAKWPDPIDTSKDADITAIGKQKIVQHPLPYLWQSVVYILELHLPYLGGGWSRLFNIFAFLGSVVLYVGCVLALPSLGRRQYQVFWMLIVYNTAVYALTGVTPRYLMPVFFCYAVFAAIGYDALITFLFRRRAHSQHHHTRA